MASPDEDQSDWPLEELLDWHFRRGTRPDGDTNRMGRTWSSFEFAEKIGYNPGSVGNWRRGESRPRNIKAITEALFGDNTAYDTWKSQLEEAHYKAFHPKKAFEAPLFRVTPRELATVASPAPSLASDGRLDAGPNATYDIPTIDDDLPTLPIRQRALIKTILGDLPGNAPRHLASALNSYDEELQARGVQPILGLLKDMAAIIDAAVGASEAEREWLEDGMKAAFERLMANHLLFVQHFPLDPKREELYSRTPVDELSATGSTLSRPFENVAAAAAEANRSGITTDDFVKIIEKMSEFASIIASQPNIGAGKSQTSIENSPIYVTPKKRIILSGFGFLERSYNLLGSSASLSALPQTALLLNAIHDGISSLSNLIRF